MQSLPPSADVVIIGGGVMGASTAYHLALRGCTNVVLLEKQPFFGQGATGKCAGGIRYQFSTAINIQLSQLSLPMLDRFEAEIGQSIDLRRCGYLFLLTRAQDVATFEHNVALQHSLGVQTEWLSPADVGRMVPDVVTDDVVAGVFHPLDGLCDPNGVVAGYISAARRLGVKSLTDSAVTRILTANGRVTGVETSQGTIACGTVVNAAGPWAAQISASAEIPLPITPLRRQILTTTPLPDLPTEFPFVIDFASGLYFHREGQGILTGMANPNEPVGFNERVDEEWEMVHMETAVARLPMLEQAGRMSHWAGLYEVTPDAHPIIDKVSDLAGYVVVAGFSGHGFMHGPAAGLLSAEIILDGRAHTLDLTPLAYNRFTTNVLNSEYNVV